MSLIQLLNYLASKPLSKVGGQWGFTAVSMKMTAFCDDVSELCTALSDLNLNSVNKLIFVTVKCGVLFEVRTEFLNNI
jgi:hypothetical protein